MPEDERLSERAALSMTNRAALYVLAGLAWGAAARSQSERDLESEIQRLSKAGDHAAALEPARKLLELRESARGRDHWDAADARRRVDSLRRIAAMPREAQLALAEAQRHMDGAEAALKKGDLAQAESLFRRALEVRTRLLGDEDADTATANNYLGLALNKQRAFAQAEPFYRKGHEVRRKLLGELHPKTATSASNLALNLMEQGRYGEAEEHSRHALEAWREVLGKDHASTATGADTLGLILTKQGKLGEAEALHTQALEVRKKVLGEDHPDTAKTYNNLAANLEEQGRLDEAEALHWKAMEIRHRALGQGDVGIATSYNNLASILDRQGRYAEAEVFHRKALAIFTARSGEDSLDAARCRNGLASNLRGQGRYQEAEALHAAALQAFERLLGEAHPDAAKARENLAVDLDEQRRHAEAEALHFRTLEIRRRVHGEDHPLTALAHENVAANLDRQGRYSEGEARHRRALRSYELVLGSQHPWSAAAYSKLAANLEAQGKYASAEAEWLRAAESFEAARLRVSFSGLGRVAFASERSPLGFLAACEARNGKHGAAWKHLEAGLSRGLLDALAVRSLRPRKDEETARESEILRSLQDLDEVISSLAGGTLPEGGTAKVESLRRERQAAQARLAEFESQQRRQHGLVVGEVYALSRIQAQIPPDAAWIAWVDSRRGSHAADPAGEHWGFVLRAQGDPACARLPGSGEGGSWTRADDELPGRFQARVAQRPTARKLREDAPKIDELARRLYRQRLAPLEVYLGAKEELPAVQHLIVVPSGAMAGIPIEALADRYIVSYAPSGTTYAWLCEKGKEARKHAPLSLLALGDPVFRPAPAESIRDPRDLGGLVATVRGAAGRDRAESLEPLPGSRSEVEALARIVAAKGTRPSILLGSDASEERLAALAASGQLAAFDFIHLATHCVLNDRLPLESAMILSQDKLPDPWEGMAKGKTVLDGRITAEQVVRTWKLDAEMVTLSACQTALGRDGGGEGFLGFSQALFIAGARSVVLSLWKVDDEATGLLMQRFYANFVSHGMAKARALQEAKRWLQGVKGGDLPSGLRGAGASAVRDLTEEKVFAHPFYWAGFVLIGEPW